MEFDTVIKKRHSANSFSSKKTSWKDVLKALESSLQAPAAGNFRHLKFILVENPETIKEISKLCEQSWISQSNFLVVFLSDDSTLENTYGERGRIYSRQQAGAAIQNFLLKITDLNLTACWVGAYPDERIRSLLKIPSHIQIEALVPIGHPDQKPKRKRKQSLESSMFWEQWNTTRRPTRFKEPPIHRE